MTKKYLNIDLAYDFITTKEKNGETFTINELSAYSMWSEKTCRTHISKKLSNYVQKDGKEHLTSGILYLSKFDFRKILSQKGTSSLDFSKRGILITKAREFALMAVSNYNNPLVNFRSYGFIVNIIIAYTALFHSIFEKNNIDYTYKDKQGGDILIDGDTKAWELTECCEYYWNGKVSPIKENIKFLIGLRNKIEHRFLPFLDLICSGECQAAITNFENIITTEFGDEYALQSSLAVSMQLSRLSSEAKTNALKQMQTENYKVVREFMEINKKNLPNEIIESQEYRISVFLIPKIGNHAKSSDISIDFVHLNNLTEEEKLSYDQGIAFIKEVQSSCRLKPSEVVNKVKVVHPKFNLVLHTKCWKFYQARPKIINREFRGLFASFAYGYDNYLYSEKWVEHLIAELSNDKKLKEIKLN
ncbi:DUF3644 domain-containing protein [Rahnella aceris]|uniref:DUF3644 domain-containing protein n=1 Tax=Rahnella sp. (strain Y9602) TaxID=2703885 RepID=UPI001F532442|nr:DUF3644 domain-containing protein [Rahnella aceris]UNK53287.1 DUF3644 domain-containing protein [Rahnella aceris]